MAKKRLRKGIFIVFEGPEGCGKSTHSRLTAKYLKKLGYDVLHTREPGGTGVGDKIRGLLLDSGKIRMSALTEMLLFEASRSELVKEVIMPALAKKRIVITDRFNCATLVYQGYAGKVPLEDIKRVESVSMRGIKPDLVIILDIDAGKGLGKTRRNKRDRMESKPLPFHKRVRKGYLALARGDRKIKVIKTRDSINDTFESVKREVAHAVRKHKESG